MAKCMNKECDNELTGRQKTYCSDKCRKAQSRTQTRTAQTRTSKSDTLTDATGKVHKIDYESRRQVQTLLESWVEGKGTAEQQMLGELAISYSIIKGYKDKDGKLTAQGRRYLGEVA